MVFDPERSDSRYEEPCDGFPVRRYTFPFGYDSYRLRKLIAIIQREDAKLMEVRIERGPGKLLGHDLVLVAEAELSRMVFIISFPDRVAITVRYQGLGLRPSNAVLKSKNVVLAEGVLRLPETCAVSRAILNAPRRLKGPKWKKRLPPIEFGFQNGHKLTIDLVLE